MPFTIYLFFKMTANYYYCSIIPDHYSYLQCKFNIIDWSLADFILFIRSLKFDFSLYEHGIKQTNGYYYIVYGSKYGSIFRIYLLKNTIRVIILNDQPFNTTVMNTFLSFQNYSHLYINPPNSRCRKEIDTRILQLPITYKVIGKTLSIQDAEISSISFQIFKKLARTYPDAP